MNTDFYMELAIKQAKKAKKLDEVPIGAILVDQLNDEIISARHNETNSQNNPLKHAELLVIEDAFNLNRDKYLVNSVIFSTLEPCVFCASAISKARIKKIYFGAYDDENGAIESNQRLYNKQKLFKPEVYGGIKEKECSELLNDFFVSKRKIND